MTTRRILIPELFDEAWDSVIIATFGADLEFFERVVLRQLSRTRNRVIFCDDRQIARNLADPDKCAQLRQLNRDYVVAPIRSGGAAHAKLIMLLSEDRGVLAVGSGNLGMTGYASQGECFSRYRWLKDDQGQLREFVAARDFIDQICERRLVDTVVKDRVRQAWQEAPWLYGRVQDSDSLVRHNLELALLDQFSGAVSGRTVDELIVHAPFYDSGCRALAELIQRTSPETLQVLLQESLTSVDPGALAEVLAGAPGRVDVRSVNAADEGTFLHAKFVIAKCDQITICLQGSPNMSSPALLHTHVDGNIELANLLVGDRSDFDHLITGLVVSPDPVAISQLDLRLADDGDEDDGEIQSSCVVAELSWVPPALTGVFHREVEVPPQLTISGAAVREVSWELEEPLAGTTRFSVRLGEKEAAVLNRVAAVNFSFEGGEQSLPTYPYHLNTLKAHASGQGRTDLLRQAGDFEVDDEELERLLAQLDEVLVVDGRSIWQMLKRKEPGADDDEPSASIAYDELDWDAIQSHPKLAQYRNLDQRSSSDPTPLGILLASIAKRFEAGAQGGRSGEPGPDDPDSGSDPLADLAEAIEVEDEKAAEEEEVARDRRRMSARSRARRQFHRFVQRFVDGLTDEEFVQRVGPSVIVPSYVLFNHFCWKLVQIDLGDPLRLIAAQTAIWRFFWGDEQEAGYFTALSAGEQEAVLEILDDHHSEAVLLCSLFQACAHVQNEKDHRALVEIRDTWRTVLVHPLWQPTKTAVDSAIRLQHECESALDLVKKLQFLAEHVAEIEPRTAIGCAVGCKPAQVIMKSSKVSRGPLDSQVEDVFVIEDLNTVITPESATRAFSALATLSSEIEYIRLEDRLHDIVAFADFRFGDFVHANRATDEYLTLASPAIEAPAWRAPLETLFEMARTGVAVA